jgi:hypothetical protein
LKALIVFSVLLGPAGRSSFLFFLAILHGVLTRAMKPFTGRSHFALVKWDHRFALFFLFNSIMVGRTAGGFQWSPSCWIQHEGFHPGKSGFLPGIFLVSSGPKQYSIAVGSSEVECARCKACASQVMWRL